jgi:hypothetical protein
MSPVTEVELLPGMFPPYPSDAPEMEPESPPKVKTVVPQAAPPRAIDGFHDAPPARRRPGLFRLFARGGT